MPRRHIRSLGELPLPELGAVLGDAWAMASRITQAFGVRVALIEHGSSGGSSNRGGACIEHAHMHLFPLGDGVDAARLRLPGSQRMKDMSDLCALAQDGRNYYLSAVDRGQCYLSADPVLLSQHARRIWAMLAGREHEWDWAAFPFYANVRLTATRLRSDASPFAESGRWLDERQLRETLDAYDAAAAWYAARTAGFAPGSTLTGEMDWLAAHTTGPILDAGSGGGRDSRYLASRSRSVLAVDASAALLAHVQECAGVETMVGDVRGMGIPDESVGAVWCSAVLLHLGQADVVRSLREFYRVVRPGGLVQVSVKEGTGRYSSAFAGNPALRRHFFLYEEHDLRQFARMAGFEIRKFWSEVEKDSSATIQRWVKILMQRPGG
jgi:SAM-dependent methyltransferase/diadenosine tetraphosphate (Ap4A) HIT family hydrolase